MISEGEVVVSSIKRWDCRGREKKQIESVTPCYGA